ncbi:hypothetical protein [Flammeovirga sp. SJP92]|uniref:hypothetical protein n=1 Tax=Flammeovirga sp. SJP92 TaxID=1775430 RepID=UPI0007874155|nr:hypothetical protein [Flammeovirga sp. SJP92]KXX69986.1 hypothetical protein AVL50_14005 [Flammeovirga sp. SJP92]
MSSEIKFSKLLVGICLNSGNSLGDVARNLGISMTNAESEALLNMMENKGFIDHPDISNKKACPHLTLKGIEQAKSLMDASI